MGNPKISVCCCSLNAKFDTKVFIEALQAQNDPSLFEIVCTHDNRIEDGSSDVFKELSNRFDNVKFIDHSRSDTENYFRSALSYYRHNKLWPSEVLECMESNFKLWVEGKLVDNSKGFLWQSSGVLYNKAVRASKGEVVIVTPGDFIYLFGLKDAHEYTKKMSRNGHFYASPPAIWARINNHPREWITQHVQDIHDGKGNNPKYRWDSRNCFRDFINNPGVLEDLNLPDFYNNHVAYLDKPGFISKAERFSLHALKTKGVQYNPHFHGFHIMTRKTFDTIGGFSEEYFHRAFADDKMTFKGDQILGKHTMPPKFSVAWCGQYELLPSTGPGYDLGWKERLPKIDKYWDKHPIPPGVARTYLYKGMFGESKAAKIVNQIFSKSGQVINF